MTVPTQKITSWDKLAFGSVTAEFLLGIFGIFYSLIVPLTPSQWGEYTWDALAHISLFFIGIAVSIPSLILGVFLLRAIKSGQISLRLKIISTLFIVLVILAELVIFLPR